MPTSKKTQSRRKTSVDSLMTPPPAPAKAEPELLAIDPGDAHVGVAFFNRNADGEWYCEDAQEWTPDEFEDAYVELVLTNPVPPIVVYERFRLYGDKSAEQTGSEFRTSQMIGVLKFVCRQRNNHVAVHEDAESQGKMTSCEQSGQRCADPLNRPQRVEIFGYMADIKKPTIGILRKKGISSVGKAARRENKGWGIHCVDAELHGWYHILKVMGGTQAAS